MCFIHSLDFNLKKKYGDDYGKPKWEQKQKNDLRNMV